MASLLSIVSIVASILSSFTTILAIFMVYFTSSRRINLLKASFIVLSALRVSLNASTLNVIKELLIS